MKKNSTLKTIIGNLDVAVASIALIVLILLTFSGVIMRYIVGKPYTWLEEVQLFCMVWIVFAAGGAAFRTGSHVAIEMVVEMVRKRSDMKVLDERDYINHVKESGYRSYHMIVSYEVETLQGTKKICVEIQIRTLGMNFWSTIEHSMQYKYQKNIPDHIRKKLIKAAQAIVVLDSEMSAVRGEIMDAQNSRQIQANLIADILNNIQNLYHLANKREIAKIQDEFYRIYEMNDIEQLKRFSQELDIIAEGYRAQALEQD